MSSPARPNAATAACRALLSCAIALGVSIPSIASAGASALPANGLAYFANKVDDVYEYLAMDWQSGEQVARWRFPDDSVLWNNWGGVTTLLEDGDLLLGGFFALKRYDIGHLR